MKYSRTKDLVSIIVTNYNNENYIVECLDSLIYQSYMNTEIIIIDDFSTDNSVILIKDWIARRSEDEKKKIKLIENAKNMGFAGAVTVGLYLAQGEYIAMQDGDDISRVDRIEKQVNFLKDNNDIMLVGCNYYVFEDSVVNAKKLPNFVVYGKENIKEEFAKGKSPVCFGTILFKGSVFDDIGGLTRRLDGAEDYEFISKALFLGIDNLKDNLYYYRLHENQRSKEFYDGSKKNKVSKDKLSVLLVLDSFNIGGTETHVLSLAKELINQQIKVTILSGGGPLGEEFKKLNCKIYNMDFPVVTPTDEDGILNFTNKISMVVKAEDINLIHAHQSTSGSLSLEVAKKINIPCIFTIHGMYYHDIANSYLKKADRIISVSIPSYEWLLNFNINSIVIPNGIIYDDFSNKNYGDLRSSFNISPDSILAIYCSRMAWGKIKVCENLIRVVRDLRKNEDINYEALIIGDGPGYKELKAAADRANKIMGKEIIHLAGNQLDVTKYYSAGDCIIGTGRVAIEGMAAGKKVIATGNSGYYGLINKDNFYDAWSTYFGDHGFRLENNAMYLYEDMRNYYLLKDKYDEDINDVYDISKKIFDISEVTKQIIDVYLDVLR